jgi:predicted RNA-binding protein with PIN domain
MRRPCWLVDGMNLIGSRAGGWWKEPGRAVRALVAELNAYAAATGDPVTLVFDSRPEGPAPAAAEIEVRFADGTPQAADRLIVELVREHPDPGTVRVVTSDGAAGGRVVGVRSFRERLERRPRRGADGEAS